MKRKSVSILGRTALLAPFALLLQPVTTFAQRRWVVVRPISPSIAAIESELEFG
jgi:hypothetical protein